MTYKIQNHFWSIEWYGNLTFMTMYTLIHDAPKHEAVFTPADAGTH